MQQGLEDKFDGANRMNLRHFISPDEKASEAHYDEDGEELDPGLPPYLYLPSPAEKAVGEKMVEERRMLQRIPTCAVFHKIASGKGVPHTFIGTCHIMFNIKPAHQLWLGFVRQWPALPRVVVRLPRG